VLQNAFKFDLSPAKCRCQFAALFGRDLQIFMKPLKTGSVPAASNLQRRFDGALQIRSNPFCAADHQIAAANLQRRFECALQHLQRRIESD